MDENNLRMLENLIMRTMTSVDNLATKVAAINTTLNESVLEDNRGLKSRADRHRRDIDLLREEVLELQQSRKYMKAVLVVIGTIISTIIIPIAAIVVSVL